MRASGRRVRVLMPTGALRMLEVDNRVMLHELTHVRFIFSGDMMHSIDGILFSSNSGDESGSDSESQHSESSNAVLGDNDDNDDDPETHPSIGECVHTNKHPYPLPLTEQEAQEQITSTLAFAFELVKNAFSIESRQ